ncbi:MAG TPA: OB-fold domain-containing protein [Burkholderiaceae bacterium]|jgi:hypothetical protein
MPLPIPKPDQLSAPFWEFARRQMLGLQRCTACGDVHFPPGPVCPRCLSDQQEWIPASGRATLFSWCRFHKGYWDSVATMLPYVVAMVKLEEGPVLMTRLVGVKDLADLRLDQPVALRFEPTAGDFTLPVFTPVEPATAPQET